MLDLRMPEVDGIEILERLGAQQLERFPTIMITGHGDISIAVRAIQLGAVHFLEKPYLESDLLNALDQAFAHLARDTQVSEARELARQLVAKLSPRESEVICGIIAGETNKSLAHKMNISVRTVEMHRGNAMERLAVKTVGDSIRVAFLGGMADKLLAKS